MTSAYEAAVGHRALTTVRSFRSRNRSRPLHASRRRGRQMNLFIRNRYCHRATLSRSLYPAFPTRPAQSQSLVYRNCACTHLKRNAFKFLSSPSPASLLSRSRDPAWTTLSPRTFPRVFQKPASEIRIAAERCDPVRFVALPYVDLESKAKIVGKKEARTRV